MSQNQQKTQSAKKQHKTSNLTKLQNFMCCCRGESEQYESDMKRNPNEVGATGYQDTTEIQSEQISGNNNDVTTLINKIVEEVGDEKKENENPQDRIKTLPYADLSNMIAQKRSGSNGSGQTFDFLKYQNQNDKKKQEPQRQSAPVDEVNRRSFDTTTSSMRRRNIIQAVDAALRQYYWKEESNSNLQPPKKEFSITLTESMLMKVGDNSMISFNYEHSDLHKYIIVADIFISGESSKNEKKLEQIKTAKYYYEDNYLDNHELLLSTITKKKMNDISFFIASVTSVSGHQLNQL